MVRKRGHRQFRAGRPVKIGWRPERWFLRGTSVEKPRNFFVDWSLVIHREFRKYIVRMLMIDQRLPMIGFARLKQFRKSRMRRSQRFRGNHLSKKHGATRQRMLLH